MAYEWARLGAKCVCIKTPYGEDIDPPAANSTLPVKGRIYTVNDLVNIYGYLCLGLDELDQDTCYSARIFRPLITLEDDVKLFQRIGTDIYGRLEVLEEMLDEQY